MTFPSIMIIGMAGVGKSTVGKVLAKETGYKFIDTDKRISELYHLPIAKLIEQNGEAWFLEQEDQIIRKLDYTHSIVAPGGSVAYHPAAVASVKSKCRVVFLKDDVVAIKKRVPNIESRGIIGMGGRTFEELYADRLPRYQAMADVVVLVQNRSVSQIVRQIMGLVR